jgi:hypothetical protein
MPTQVRGMPGLPGTAQLRILASVYGWARQLCASVRCCMSRLALELLGSCARWMAAAACMGAGQQQQQQHKQPKIVIHGLAC